MTLKTFWILCALNLIGWGLGWAGEPEHLKNPVWVMVFWLHPLDGKETVEIDSIELGGEAVSPRLCAALPMNEVLKPLDDASQKVESGLTPVVVCGIAAPTESKEKPHVRSEPGHPDQPQGPSGNILYLPHRISFDIQGHQPPSAGEAQACHDSGGTVIRVPGTGLFLECVHGSP